MSDLLGRIRATEVVYTFTQAEGQGIISQNKQGFLKHSRSCLTVAHEPGSIFFYQRQRILCLVVFGNIGRRHQHGRFADHTQLTDRKRTGAGYDHIRSGIQQIHPVDKCPEVYVGQFGRVAGAEFGFVKLSALPQYLNLWIIRQQGGVVAKRIIEGSGAEAASYHCYGFFVGVQPVMLHRLIAFGSQVENILAHRIAGENDLFSGEELFHVIVRHTNDRSLFASSLFVTPA